MNTVAGRKRLRLEEYDYSLSGAYFVTICIQEKEHFFGEIQNEEMTLSLIGMLIKRFWDEIPSHFPEIELDDSFVVMPDHIHGIIWILDEVQKPVGDADLRPLRGARTKMLLSKVIHGFKSSVSREIHRKYGDNHSFAWQRSFYDRIIRNEEELNRIREYIVQNPMKWGKDEEFLFFEND